MIRHWRPLAIVAAVAICVPIGVTMAQSEPRRESIPTSEYKKIADFAEWRIDGREYLVRDVHTSGAASVLTHLEYSFGDVTAAGLCAGEPDHDYRRLFRADQSVDGSADVPGQPLAGNFGQLGQLKARYPNLRVIYSIGGWGGSQYFSTAALTPESREQFVASCVDQYIKGNVAGNSGAAAGIFDGIDVDWEWPGSEGESGNVVRPQDKQNFTLLLAEFRRQLDVYGAEVDRRFSLSTFLPDDPKRIEAGFEPAIFAYLDYASVAGFDFHGTWDRITNHASQLYTAPDDPSGSEASVDQAISAWLALGAPPKLLSVAIPAFGRGWRGVSATNRGLYQRAAGPATGGYEPGTQDYRVLAALDGERFRDEATGAQWLYDGDEWWTFDDPWTIAAKADYVRRRGLGGMTLWSLDGDDSTGSLVEAMSAGLDP